MPAGGVDSTTYLTDSLVHLVTKIIPSDQINPINATSI